MGWAFFDVKLRTQRTLRGNVGDETVEGHVDTYEMVRVAAPEGYDACDVAENFNNLEDSVPELIDHVPEDALARKLVGLSRAELDDWVEAAQIVGSADIEIEEIDEVEAE